MRKPLARISAADHQLLRPRPVYICRLPFAILVAAVASLLFMNFSLLAGPRDAQWQQVEEAIKKGLPKTAITNLEPIIQGALKDKAYAEAVKAIGQKIALEGNIQGNKPEEKITRLEAVPDLRYRDGSGCGVYAHANVRHPRLGPKRLEYTAVAGRHKPGEYRPDRPWHTQPRRARVVVPAWQQ